MLNSLEECRGCHDKMEASFRNIPAAGLRSRKNTYQDGSSTKLCTADQHRQECRLRKSQENREAVRVDSRLSNPKYKKQKAKYMTHYRNGKAILRVDRWSSLGSSQTAASHYNLKELMWWHSATSKPAAHMSYAIMKGKRLSGNWFFSQALFFHARKIMIWFCSHVAVAHS